MAYLGVIEAVLSRLQGYPRERVPELPQQPDQYLTRWTEVDSGLKKLAETTVVNVQVPIYYLDPSGRELDELLPASTFNMIGVTPRFAPGENVFNSKMYAGDTAYEDVAETKETITYTDGVALTGAVMRRVRPVQHPFDFLVEIHALADSELMSALLLDHLYGKVFSPRDFIRVPMKDGSYRSWDMIFRGAQDLDSRRAVRSGSPGTERLYDKVWTYLIEGYLDNTDTTFLMNVTKKRTVSVTKGG